MQWKNVKLIYLREMRDQLRDRRTLFLIAVLPLLLYPLLGTTVFQLTQFLEHHAAKVLVLGAEQLNEHPWLPPLVEGETFAPQWFDAPEQRDNLQIESPDGYAGLAKPGPERDAKVEKLLSSGAIEAVVEFPPDFAKRLTAFRAAMTDRTASPDAIPEPTTLFNSASDKSQLAQLRVDQVLRQWRSAVAASNLAAGNVPAEAAKPFEVKPRDVAPPQLRRAAEWAKILPFIVFIWALTGAFYPAVDLCAGEKERGTLETLLTSPALRREIVWGKLLAVMTFSNVTALLNLASLGVTAKFVVAELSRIAPVGAGSPLELPPLGAILWLAVALVPISALFSALCLACAALARSSKEGQYYLMPIMLVSLPLMMLPMSPGVELNLGNSLVPLTGVVLLLRTVIEGQYSQALPYVLPVVGVTLACCLLAIRWAEEQFNRESVLFRESERLELRRWLVHLVRDRDETPSVAQAALCAALIVAVQFFVSVAVSSQGATELTFSLFAKSILVSQLACVLTPALVMTIMLTRNPAKTLLLDRAPSWKHLFAAAALAFLLHGPARELVVQLQKVYPLQPEVQSQAEAMEQAMAGAPNWGVLLALLAILPPLCEEIAFRGFILSGLRRLGHKWWAIALSSVAFGFVHLFIQQKLSAAALGLVLGYLAVQTASLWPAIVFHATHNGLQLLAPKWAAGAEPGSLASRLLGREHPLVYHPAVVACCGLAALAILWQFAGLSYRRSAEEQLEEARRRQGRLAGAN